MTQIGNRQVPGNLIERADPAQDARAFRRTLGQFATGVTVITTSANGQYVGMAANSFSAVSLEPALVLWSIRKESRSIEAFKNNGHFAVSVLSVDQMDTAGLFGKPQPNQFDNAPWTPSVHGDPLLNDAIAHFECATHEILDGGDHFILIGKVEQFSRFEGAPLLFAQGQYGVAEGHPSLALTSNSPSAPGENESEQALFLTLIKSVDHHMSLLFQEHRREVGVSVTTARILNLLSQGPSSADSLQREAFLGEEATEDALSELIARGYVTSTADGALELTAEGKETRARLRQSAEEFTTRQLKDIPEKDLAAAERVMKILLTR